MINAAIYKQVMGSFPSGVTVITRWTTTVRSSA